jgi:hypothetical protein
LPTNRRAPVDQASPWRKREEQRAESERRTRPQGIRLEVVKLPEAKHGYVLLPRRWVIEQNVIGAWVARFRHLARDYERLPTTTAGLHFLAFACLLLHRLIPLLAESS